MFPYWLVIVAASSLLSITCPPKFSLLSCTPSPSSKNSSCSDGSVPTPYQLLIFRLSLLETNPINETESHFSELKNKLCVNLIEVQGGRWPGCFQSLAEDSHHFCASVLQLILEGWVPEGALGWMHKGLELSVSIVQKTPSCFWTMLASALIVPLSWAQVPVVLLE